MYIKKCYVTKDNHAHTCEIIIGKCDQDRRAEDNFLLPQCWLQGYALDEVKVNIIY